MMVFQGESLKNLTQVSRIDVNATAGGAYPSAVRRSTWAQAEGTPLPLGATWIESEQAFNFALHSERAESVALLFYSATDLVNPVFTFRFDFLRNKSGPVWHCRIPAADLGDARYYAYSVSGPVGLPLHALTHRRFFLTRTRNASSFRLDSTGRWPLEKDRTRGAPFGRACCPSDGLRLGRRSVATS